MKYKVTVIIPIYKVERFIARCAESLMRQTLPEVQFVFVDDATPDGSVTVLETVLERFPERRSDVMILRHDVNKGLPSARNTGLSVAEGDFIFHCDSDDYVEVDMLAKMYALAEKESADIVWCDWYLSFEGSERYMRQPDYGDSEDALKAMLSGGMKYNVWNKLALRRLYVENAISFPDGYGMGEDMTMMLLFMKAGKVAHLPEAMYHYIKTNSGAFSQTYSERHLVELRHNVDRITNATQKHFGSRLDKELAFFKLDVKFPFLLADNASLRKLWYEWYPEVDKYILDNKYVSRRTRLVQWMASNRLSLLVTIYRFLLQKVVYGAVYR